MAYANTDPTLAQLKRKKAERQRELYRHIIGVRRARTDSTKTGSRNEPDPAGESDAALLHAVIDGLAMQLADLNMDEAATLGPAMLDHYLTQTVDN